MRDATAREILAWMLSNPRSIFADRGDTDLDAAVSNAPPADLARALRRRRDALCERPGPVN